MTDWKLIPSIVDVTEPPFDGEEYLLVDVTDVGYPTFALATYEAGAWRDMGDIGAAGQDGYEPTHWMPLPEPPK